MMTTSSSPSIASPEQGSGGPDAVTRPAAEADLHAPEGTAAFKPARPATRERIRNVPATGKPLRHWPAAGASEE